MSRLKRLNIGNTDRHYNVNLMQRQEIVDKIKITRLNEKEIEKEMDELAEKSSPRVPERNDKAYILFQESYNNDTLIAKVLNHAGSVSYYTDTVIPYYVLRRLANNLTSEAIYSVKKDYTKEELENIQLSFMACPVVVDCPVVVPDINPYDILFALHPLKTSVDKVQVSFPWLSEKEYSDRHKPYYHKVGDHYEATPQTKYRYFKYIQTSLSIWAMNIWLVCDSFTDMIDVQDLIEKERGKKLQNSIPRKKEKI